MNFLHQYFIPYFNYWIYVLIMMIGLHAMIVKKNLIKKLIGMSIFSTAIILFYVSIGVNNGGDIASREDGKANGNIPVLEHSLLEEAAKDPSKVDHRNYANPLPHVLMLTAIVVGVATLGVGLAVTQRIYRDYDSLEEDEILAKIASAPACPTDD